MHPIDYELRYMLVGEFEKGWQISQELEEQGPDNISMEGTDVPPDQTVEERRVNLWMRHCFNRGWFMLQQGKYQEGSQLLENGRHLNVYGGYPLKTSAPLYNPQTHDIVGKSIILSLEGGFGDEIIHARFATSFKKLGAKHVYIAASPELLSVLSRIEGVDGVIQRDQSNTVPHDYWIPGFSAGWVCGHSYDTIYDGPYISPLPDSSNVWKTFINSSKIKIGIRWAGNPKFEHQQFRTFPPEFLTNLSKYTELQLYSFQRDNTIIELPNEIVDLQHLLISWEDTLAALNEMDLVITSCTSIAHAAAAMGKLTWVLTPLLPYHIWAKDAPYSTTSPYYDSVTLYRQCEPEQWNSTFQRLYMDVEQKFNLIHQELPSCDKDFIKINLGAGLNKLDGYINVDISPDVEADQVVDLESFPWPWADSSVSHIVAKDILEHLGQTSKDFIKVIKEMYRISKNGAVWEVQFPHHRCDIAIDDPTHVRLITPVTLMLFDQKRAMEFIKIKRAESRLSIECGVDIEVCETQYEWSSFWTNKVKSGEITEQDLMEALYSNNNVAVSTIQLIQVHKPGRSTFK